MNHFQWHSNRPKDGRNKLAKGKIQWQVRFIQQIRLSCEETRPLPQFKENEKSEGFEGIESFWLKMDHLFKCTLLIICFPLGPHGWHSLPGLLSPEYAGVWCLWWRTHHLEQQLGAGFQTPAAKIKTPDQSETNRGKQAFGSCVLCHMS